MSLPKQTLALHFKCCCHRHYNYPQVCHRQTRTYPHQSRRLQMSWWKESSWCCGWRAVGKLAHLILGSPLYTWHATLLPTQTLAGESPIWAELMQAVPNEMNASMIECKYIHAIMMHDRMQIRINMRNPMECLCVSSKCTNRNTEWASNRNYSLGMHACIMWCVIPASLAASHRVWQSLWLPQVNGRLAPHDPHCVLHAADCTLCSLSSMLECEQLQHGAVLHLPAASSTPPGDTLDIFTVRAVNQLQSFSQSIRPVHRDGWFLSFHKIIMTNWNQIKIHLYTAFFFFFFSFFFFYVNGLQHRAGRSSGYTSNQL